MILSLEINKSPLQISEGQDLLSHPEIARTLGYAQDRYDLRGYLPPNVDAGLNLATALAAMHAIDHKGQKDGWEYGDLLAALPVTRVALTTAGFAHAKEGLDALLTGTTGDFQSIVEKILPQDASKGIKLAVKTIVAGNNLDNMRVVLGLLFDEKRIERRLLRLTKIQQDLLLDPGRTRALLKLLNGDYNLPSTLIRTGLPQEAETHLEKICPFSLEDMSVVSNLFTAVEWSRNSFLQVEAQRLRIQTELTRLEAAGLNVAKLATLGTSSVIKNTLLVVGGTFGGIGSGVILAGDEAIYQVKRAIESVKQKNEERRTLGIDT